MEVELTLKIILGIVFLAALAAVLVGLFLGGTRKNANYIWKVAIIIGVLTGSGYLVLPVQQQLKYGLDLRGGTTLVYEVDVPAGMSAKQAVEDTIAVLRRRVDPNGVRGLVWRPTGTNRVEIEMALPSAETTKRRQEYLEAQKNLFQGNITRANLDGLLGAKPAERAGQLANLAGGNAQRRAMLEQMLAAQDALAAARQPYEDAQAAVRKAEAALKDVPATAPAEEREKVQKRIDAVIQEVGLEAKTQAFLAAKAKLEAGEKAVLDTGIEPQEWDRLTGLSNQPTKDKDGKPGPGLRQQAVDELARKHPDRAELIRAVNTTYAAYENLKGSLDDPNDLIALLHGAGVLEFRIAPAPGEVPDVAAYREQLATKGPRVGTEKPYRWFEVDDLERFAEGQDAAETQANKKHLEADPATYLAQRYHEIAASYNGKVYLLLANTPDASMTQAQPGWMVTGSHRSQAENGMPAVAFNLNTTGGQLMGALTGSHLQKPMAIVLDDQVKSSPTIQSRIMSNGQITGGRAGFSPRELDYLTGTLNAGSLKARLSTDPIYIQTTGPQFGQDNLRAGRAAFLWSFVLVSLFMLVYYMFWGVVADFALIVNLLIVLAFMGALGAPITLPGIAGLVLTIGMAVDANVLVYERIREEMERAASLEIAVREGYRRAWATILDAHVTALITCVVLYYTATADIKGFALTLGIGLLANLFTGVYCSRVISDIYLHLVRPKTLPMLPMLVPAIRKALHPNIDWIGKRYLFFGISGTLAVAGLVAIVMRGADFLDIEFRSGTQVTFKLAADPKNPGHALMLDIQDVRKRLTDEAKKANLPELADATPVTVGDTVGGKASEFTVSTIITDTKAVSNALKQAFGDVIDVQQSLAFDGGGDKDKAAPPLADVRDKQVFPITSANLAPIGAPVEVPEYVGGVAIVLSNLQPAPTLAELTGRIQHMMQAQDIGFRPFEVKGLQPANAERGPGGAAPTGDQTRWSKVAIVARDGSTNYLQNPDSFKTEGGLADSEWHIVRDAAYREASFGSVSSFSSQVSGTMQRQAIAAMGLSCLAIMAYIWFRFGSFKYGVAAIIATLHDVVIAVGFMGLSKYGYDLIGSRFLLLEPFRLNLAQVAAILTLIGYSLNDTVVIFDRIRENRGRLAEATPGIINASINQTISRTVLTSGTVFIAVLLLYVIGGAGVHGFAYTMLVGTIVGCYSSIAIASPILLVGKHVERLVTAPATVPGTPGKGASPATR